MVYAGVDHGPPLGVMILPSNFAEICVKAPLPVLRSGGADDEQVPLLWFVNPRS